MKKNISKATKIEEFLRFIDECRSEYDLAFEEVGREDRRLQDLLHELEFAQDKAERGRSATNLHNSRRNRRENKDLVQLNEEIVKFFSDRQNRQMLERMRQMLGQQRKREEYLKSERVYIPRVEGDAKVKIKADQQMTREEGNGK